MNTEAMTDERLAEIEALATGDEEPPLTWSDYDRITMELVTEIKRMRACKVCDGARVLFNDGGTMRPAHGWTGPLVGTRPTDEHKHGVPILAGQAYECLSCKAMDDAQDTPPSLPLRAWSPA